MATSLLQSFNDLDDTFKNILADITSPLQLSLVTLKLADDIVKVKTLTAEHIVACLEAAGVAVKKRSIQKALAKANGRVSVTNDPLTGESTYKLMTKGKQEADKILKFEPLSVFRIEAGKPRTARSTLVEIMRNLSGIVRICDPYYGTKTLDTLEQIPKDHEVRFLTDKTSDNSLKIENALKDYKTERPKTTFKKVKHPSPLHDRYILSDKILIILGHGLKDIGGKESFLIILDASIVPDLIAQISKVFDDLWMDGLAL